MRQFQFYIQIKKSAFIIPTSLTSTFTITAIRLVSPDNSPSSGRVEVLHMGTWGTIYDNSWDLREADVVCRQLGYDGALSAPSYAAFGQRTDQIWLYNVHCEGDEISILDCSHSGWGVHYCWHFNDAGVVCRPTGKAVIHVPSALVKVILLTVSDLLIDANPIHTSKTYLAKLSGLTE